MNSSCMKRILAIVGVMTMSLCGCQVVDRSGEEDIILKFIENYYRDFSSRDWITFRTYFWEDGTITTVWQQPGDTVSKVHSVTIDEFIRQTPDGPDSQPVFEERLLNAEIEVRGNLARVWARYNAIFGTEQHLSEWQGTDLFSLLKHDGTWKIVSLTFESD
jgi:hypothetical protein